MEVNLLLASVGSSEAGSPAPGTGGEEIGLSLRAGLLEETAEEGIEGELVSPDRVGRIAAQVNGQTGSV